MATYQFDYPISSLSINNSKQSVTKVVLNVTIEHLSGEHTIISLLYNGTEVLDLMKIFAPKAVLEILSTGVKYHFHSRTTK